MARQSKLKKKQVRSPVQTRAKLLQAAIELVGEKGAAALSLKEAALRANLSRGIAYWHFDDREQLLNEAKNWISEGLADGIRRFDANASLHDRTFHNFKLVLEHPEASKLMIIAAMSGADLDRRHPLYKLVSNMLKELKDTCRARADIDLEILTYMTFGLIASIIMLGAQRKGNDIDSLAERFTNEWNRIVQEAIFVRKAPPHSGARKRTARPGAKGKSTSGN
jgi:AcrR family transcriptional regulator